MANPLFYMLGWVFQIISFVCFIIIVIDAFKKEIWKGILTFICCFYSLYYAFAEYESANKTQIILGWLVAGFIAGILMFMGQGAPAG